MSDSSALTSPESEHSAPVRLAATDGDDVDMDNSTAGPALVNNYVSLTHPRPASPRLTRKAAAAAADAVAGPPQQKPVVVDGSSPVALPSQAAVLPSGPGGFGRHRGLLLSRPASAQSYHTTATTAATTRTSSPIPTAAAAAASQPPNWQRTIRRPASGTTTTASSIRPRSFHAGDEPPPLLDVVAHRAEQDQRLSSSADDAAISYGSSDRRSVGNLHPSDPTLFDGGLPTAMPALFTAKPSGGDTPSAYFGQAMQTQQQHPLTRPSAMMQRFDDQRPATSPSLRSYATDNSPVPAFNNGQPPHALPYGAHVADPHHQNHHYPPPPAYNSPRMHAYLSYGSPLPTASYLPGSGPHVFGPPLHAHPHGYAQSMPHAVGAPVRGGGYVYAPPPPTAAHGAYASGGHWRPPHPTSTTIAGAYASVPYRPASVPASYPGPPVIDGPAGGRGGGTSSCDPLVIQQLGPNQQLHARRQGSDWSTVSSVDSHGRRSTTHAEGEDEDEGESERELEEEVDFMRTLRRMDSPSDDSDDDGGRDDDDDDPMTGHRRRSSAARFAPHAYYDAPPHMYASSTLIHPSDASYPHPGYAISYGPAGGPAHGLHPPTYGPFSTASLQPSIAPPVSASSTSAVRIKVKSPSASSGGSVKKSRSKSTRAGGGGRASKVPAPIPVPNLSKRSRGRHVPLDEDEVKARKGGHGKAFQCDVADCRKWFGRTEHLKRHTRSLHTNEKPFKCPHPTCDKFFSRHDNLNQHFRIHRSNEADALAMKGLDFSAMGIRE